MLELFPDSNCRNAVDVYISTALLARLVQAGATPADLVVIRVEWIKLCVTVDKGLSENRVRVPNTYWHDMCNLRRGKLNVDFLVDRRVIMREGVSLVNAV